jgi:hypothetical protein
MLIKKFDFPFVVGHLYQIISTSSNKNTLVKRFIRPGKPEAEELLAILITCDYDEVKSALIRKNLRVHSLGEQGEHGAP